MIYLIPTDTCFWIACSLDDCESYNKIYDIKKRDFSKPLAIMVEDFKWLENNTDLNGKQIEFLKKYDKPFTVLTDSDHVKAWLNFEDDEIKFVNKEQYILIAFRVANNEIQKKLIKEIGPIFLTSANISDKPEIYKVADLKNEFKYFIEKKQIQILGEKDLSGDNPPSDIFEFVWDSLEVKYLRKS